MESLTLSVVITGITCVAGAILGILFIFARDEADRLAEENTELRAALEAKRKEADTLSDDVSRLARQLKEQSETIGRFNKRGYIRNAYGTLQRYSEWVDFGDKEPKRREKKRDEQKTPLTRAEACLAILTEAKDAGFPWAESAIEQFDENRANKNYSWDRKRPLSRAVGTFNVWMNTKEGWCYWDEIAHSKEVKHFKPKTQWPA